MLSFPFAGFLPSGRQLALPLPLFMLLAVPAAHGQVMESASPAAASNQLTDVSLYPNPAHIRATVQVPAVPGATRAIITVMDGQGKVVFEQPMSLTATGGSTEVPLLGRAPGLYRVQVQVGEERTARTLRVE